MTKLYVSATFVPPPGSENAPGVATEQLLKETESSQLGGTLRELLTAPSVGDLLAMGASVVIVISKHKVGTSAVLERMQ